MIHRLVNRPISHADRRGNTPQAGSNLGLGLLDEADDRVDHHDTEDHRRVDGLETVEIRGASPAQDS
jgi:hypothetical protein